MERLAETSPLCPAFEVRRQKWPAPSLPLRDSNAGNGVLAGALQRFSGVSTRCGLDPWDVGPTMVTRYGAIQAYRVGELGEPMEASGGGSSEKPVADPGGQICWASHGVLPCRAVEDSGNSPCSAGMPTPNFISPGPMERGLVNPARAGRQQRCLFRVCRGYPGIFCPRFGFRSWQEPPGIRVFESPLESSFGPPDGLVSRGGTDFRLNNVRGVVSVSA